MSRVLLFTGKGGVGKTTVAAATAARAAAAGRRVLITSTDPAHSLADAYDVPLGNEPVTVDDGLEALQIDARARLERHWQDVREYLVELLAWGGVGEVEAEELALLPGLDELFALIDLRDQVAAGDHDLIVVDCAPTAETLQVLALPDALGWYVDRILTPGRNVARAVRPVTSRVGGMPVPDDEVFGAVERVHGALTEVNDVLRDSGRTSFRLVVNPERMVVNEALRTATSLSLFGYVIDAVVVNRILPDEIDDPYLERWQELHAEHTDRVRESFAPTPVLTAPLFDRELVGPAGLRGLAQRLYGDGDETAVMHESAPLSVEATEAGFRLRLRLPFASRDDLDLHRRGDELHVRVGGLKRAVPLPAALQRCDVDGARLSDGHLDVRFVEPTPAPTGASA